MNNTQRQIAFNFMGLVVFVLQFTVLGGTHNAAFRVVASDSTDHLHLLDETLAIFAFCDYSALKAYVFEGCVW